MKASHLWRYFCFFILTSAIGADSARAAVIHTVTVQAASATESNNADRQPLWTLGGAGFTAVGSPIETSGHSNSRQNNTWITSAATADDAFVTYDFGTVRSDITKMFIWNHNVPGSGTWPNNETNRGIQQFDVWTSETDPLSGATPVGIPALSNQMLSQNLGTSGSNQVTMFDLSGLAPFRYLRIDADTNFGGNVTGLAEVMFHDSRQDLTDVLGGTIMSNFPGTGSETVQVLADDSIRTKWLDTVDVSTLTPVNIDYTFTGGAQPYVTSYVLSSANDRPERDPTDWTLQGSNDGVDWDILDTVNGFVFPNESVTNNANLSSRLQGAEFVVDTPGYYNMYRLQLTETNGTPESTPRVQLGDFQFYGIVPEPTSLSLLFAFVTVAGVVRRRRVT